MVTLGKRLHLCCRALMEEENTGGEPVRPVEQAHEQEQDMEEGKQELGGKEKNKEKVGEEDKSQKGEEEASQDITHKYAPVSSFFYLEMSS